VTPESLAAIEDPTQVAPAAVAASPIRFRR
jgi:hypothetical protein